MGDDLIARPVCSFCDADANRAVKMFRGRCAFICEACVLRCIEAVLYGKPDPKECASQAGAPEAEERPLFDCGDCVNEGGCHGRCRREAEERQ